MVPKTRPDPASTGEPCSALTTPSGAPSTELSKSLRMESQTNLKKYLLAVRECKSSSDFLALLTTRDLLHHDLANYEKDSQSELQQKLSKVQDIYQTMDDNPLTEYAESYQTLQEKLKENQQKIGEAVRGHVINKKLVDRTLQYLKHELQLLCSSASPVQLIAAQNFQRKTMLTARCQSCLDIQLLRAQKIADLAICMQQYLSTKTENHILTESEENCIIEHFERIVLTDYPPGMLDIFVSTPHSGDDQKDPKYNGFMANIETFLDLTANHVDTNGVNRFHPHPRR